MNKVYLVTEGAFDVEMLRKILPEDVVSQTEFITGAGRYSAQSLARSILTAKRAPVALVIDADTVEPSAIEEQKDFLKELLNQASAGTPFEVFIAVPELEVLLVDPPEVLGHISHHPPSANEAELAKLQPKKFLSELLAEGKGKQSISKAIKMIDNQTLALIRQHPLIQSLSQFLSTNQLVRG